MRRLARVAALWPVVLAGGALANEGRIPVSQPTTINQPGYYILTRDLSVASSPGIKIQADDVVLDLNGRSITSTADGSIVLIADGFKDITVRNGRLIGTTPNAIGVGYSSTVSRTRLTVESLQIANGTIGVNVGAAEYVEVLSCRIDHMTRAGVVVQGATDTFSGRFVGNAITGATGTSPGSLVSGLELYAQRGGEIRNNVVTGPGTTSSHGIQVVPSANLGGPALTASGGTLIADNTISFSNVGSVLFSIGIVVSSNHNLIVHNVVKGPLGIGILTNSSGNFLLENVTSGVPGSGINLSPSPSGDPAARNYLDGNLSEGNAQCGIESVTPGNVYRNSMLRNNTGGATCGGSPLFNAGSNIL